MRSMKYIRKKYNVPITRGCLVRYGTREGIVKSTKKGSTVVVKFKDSSTCENVHPLNLDYYEFGEWLDYRDLSITYLDNENDRMDEEIKKHITLINRNTKKINILENKIRKLPNNDSDDSVQDMKDRIAELDDEIATANNEWAGLAYKQDTLGIEVSGFLKSKNDPTGVYEFRWPDT